MIWLSDKHRERALKILARLPESQYLDVLLCDTGRRIRKLDREFYGDALDARAYYEQTPVATILHELRALMVPHEANDNEEAQYLRAVGDRAK